MKRLLLSFLILFVFVNSYFSQTTIIQPPEPTRIAFINSYEFYDKNGVDQLRKAAAGVDEVFYGNTVLGELARLTNQKTKELENKDLNESQKVEIKKSLALLIEKGEIIQKQQLESIEKRKTLLLKPVLDKIAAQLTIIANQNKLAIFDLGEDGEGLFLALDEKTDLTKSVIDAINDYFKTGLDSSVKIEAPQPKLAYINTELFYDEKNGIKRLVQANKDFEQINRSFLAKNPTKEEIDWWIKLCRKNPSVTIHSNIGKSIDKFARENGFTLILDSGKKIPAQLEKFPSLDVTNEFISYYNQINQ